MLRRPLVSPMREASPFASMCSGGDLRELLINCSVVLRPAPFGERHAGMHWTSLRHFQCRYRRYAHLLA